MVMIDIRVTTKQEENAIKLITLVTTKMFSYLYNLFSKVKIIYSNITGKIDF